MDAIPRMTLRAAVASRSTRVVVSFGCAVLAAAATASQPTICPIACAEPPCAIECAAPPAVPGPLRIPVVGVSRSALPSGDFDAPRGADGARHEAIDIAAPRGTAVVAVEDGTIAKLFLSDAGGRTVYQFDPTGRLAYYYAHLDAYAPDLAEGMPVVRGQPLGFVGTTGNAPEDAPHLHFAIFRLGADRAWWQGEAIDPFPFLLEGSERAADALALYGTTAALEEAQARLVAAAEAGGWPSVGAGPTLERDDAGTRVEDLRTRLAASGDLEPAPEDAAGDAASFDARLETAVRRFQVRHGLEPDGRVGPETRAALDVSPRQRADQIAANLEARRRLERVLEPRFVLVNVPDYRLLVVEGRATALSMAVAVGRPDWSTPPIDDSIERIVVNPAWDVPSSIVRAEVAPRAARDPGYLRRNDMVLLAGNRVRQQPGPRNPLGRLKFVFPNREDIYLHDTPGQAVFDRRERSVSHGCLRLDDARALAEYLLRDVPGWDRARLDATIDAGRTESIPLAPPVPIHIVYWTAWVDDAGQLQLRKDLYADAVDPDTAPLVDSAPGAPAPRGVRR